MIILLIKPNIKGSWKVVGVRGMKDVLLFEGSYLECFEYKQSFTGLIFDL